MKLYRYLSRLQSTIYSHREIEIERLVIHSTTALSGRIWGRLRFYDGSLFFTQRGQSDRWQGREAQDRR